MCSSTHASQALVRLLRRSKRLGMPPEGEVLPPFLRGESWVLETPLESLPGPPEGVLSPPDPSWIPAGASGGSSLVSSSRRTRPPSPIFWRYSTKSSLQPDKLTSHSHEVSGVPLALKEVLPLSSDLPIVQDFGHLILHFAIDKLQRSRGEGDAVLTVT